MLRRVDDPESRKSLKPLDPPVKPGDDIIFTFVMFSKDLIEHLSPKGMSGQVDFKISNIERV